MANRKPLALFTEEGVVCRTVEETVEVGVCLGEGLGVGSVVSLEGPLGAGKTQVVKGLARALGCGDVISSPSFAIVLEYGGEAGAVYHFDFYRMESADELLTVGYDDCLAEGVVLIEWGNKFPEVLPEGTLRLELEVLGDGARRVRGRVG